MMRAPILLYRLGIGFVLGRRFVLIEHTGRVTGATRRTVLEVVGKQGTTLWVASAWPRSDWLRNVQAHPDVRISTGFTRRVDARASVVDEQTAGRVLRSYAHDHPRAAAVLRRSLGLPFDDAAELAAVVPIVEIVRFEASRAW
jgi:deazaflavin-dependent oxidoreductase (nitroreductase family)